MNIAVIPARGGSKRIVRKNIKDFCGKPLIAWSIAAARESGCFDRILVSTDDDEIMAVAEACGAEAPFRRPAELADDFTPTVPVIAHAVEWAQKTAQVERACCIYATAPLLRADDLVRGCVMLDDKEWDYAFSVTTFPFPIERALRLDGRGHVAMIDPAQRDTRSQDLEEAYHDAGQFYWGRTEAWLAHRPIFAARSAAVVLPRKRVQDIDTPEDWERAELLFRMLGENHFG
ncbi:pseudaminic acid cytidylyltransferase [Sphingomonas sp. CFBP 8764]|uniref:pseudaminic acid cytidylyltransferase n=1 Tax=Sphingomonas sp. CFBP 8764 TaxID=2775275 RepID=UPI00177E20DD|nr:pseudaminic acid cytidylyltransferase [Sphingomonas sp. CFBP 8764]MBD8552711.1 pseudaminic acid cytidylyltransferase [Sphingomonas sp. CFBP 8764]